MFVGTYQTYVRSALPPSCLPNSRPHPCLGDPNGFQLERQLLIPAVRPITTRTHHNQTQFLLSTRILVASYSVGGSRATQINRYWAHQGRTEEDAQLCRIQYLTARASSAPSHNPRSGGAVLFSVEAVCSHPDSPALHDQGNQCSVRHP